MKFKITQRLMPHRTGSAALRSGAGRGAGSVTAPAHRTFLGWQSVFSVKAHRLQGGVGAKPGRDAPRNPPPRGETAPAAPAGHLPCPGHPPRTAAPRPEGQRGTQPPRAARTYLRRGRCGRRRRLLLLPAARYRGGSAPSVCSAPLRCGAVPAPACSPFPPPPRGPSAK